MKITIHGNPITKKNSQRIVMVKGHPIIIPSAQYKEYEKQALKQLTITPTITEPVNVKCTYYMATRRKVDLTNLLEATDDILVKGLILLDDNSDIIASHDGSRVVKPDKDPRVEIEITEAK